MKDFLNPDRYIYPFILVLILMAFAACSSNKGDYNSLVNQGLLPLSPTNAYLGSNLYLGEEAEKSRVLYEFLKGRGAPGAIEIVKHNFKAKSMMLFYPRQSHYYIADLLNDKNSYEWIVKGPYTIDREVFRKMVEIQRNHYEAAPFIIDGKITSFYQPPPTPTARPVLPTATPKAIKKTVKPKPVSTEHLKSSATPTSAVPTVSSVIPSGPGLNSDQQAIRISKGLVELSPTGDLVHKVASDSETFDQIASWYTGDSAKAKAIAEFNGLASGSPLAKGAKIKIPKDISKTDKAMGK